MSIVQTRDYILDYSRLNYSPGFRLEYSPHCRLECSLDYKIDIDQPTDSKL